MTEDNRTPQEEIEALRAELQKTQQDLAETKAALRFEEQVTRRFADFDNPKGPQVSDVLRQGLRGTEREAQLAQLKRDQRRWALRYVRADEQLRVSPWKEKPWARRERSEAAMLYMDTIKDIRRLQREFLAECRQRSRQDWEQGDLYEPEIDPRRPSDVEADLNAKEALTKRQMANLLQELKQRRER
jgi:hypothetical protein